MSKLGFIFPQSAMEATPRATGLYGVDGGETQRSASLIKNAFGFK